MKDQRKTEIKVGVTVTVALILLLWIFGWAKNFSYNQNRSVLFVRFPTVSGLSIGDQVTVNGLKKGFVEDIKIDGQSVITRLSIEKDVDLKTDATYEVVMLDLMGGKKVDITPGKSTAGLNYNEIQNGRYASDISSSLASLGPIAEKLPEITEKINKILDGVNTYLNDQQLKNDITESVKNAKVLTAEVTDLIKSQKKALEELLGNANTAAKNANSLITDNKDELNHLLKRSDDLLVQGSTVIKNIDSLFSETTQKKNNLGKLMYDSTTMDDLKVVLENVKVLTEILVTQMKEKGIKVDAKLRLF